MEPVVWKVVASISAGMLALAVVYLAYLQDEVEQSRKRVAARLRDLTSSDVDLVESG